MSADKIEADTMMCCASCGITAEVDDIKLKNCTACYLVKYCGIKCQKEHRPKHKRECKRRATELRDELLFKQPESSHLGDCPICFIPLQLDLPKSCIQTCCSKVICKGCSHAKKMCEMEDSLQQRCPFCREATPSTEEGCDKQMMKRIEMNDPVAISQGGGEQYTKGNYRSAFEYFTKAAGLGNADAHYHLSLLYRFGHGVEKDEKKRLYNLEKAVIGGHPLARCNLGGEELKDGQLDRAIKHFIIAAKLGSDESLAALKQLYENEFISKGDFATALRAHQAAVDATKSPQREAAEKYRPNRTSGVDT
eukprot:scaffold14600_cov150-Skeletonema_dohrnii-CCMP3373.AAC.7